MALLDMWRANRDGIREKSVHQILAFAGEAKLADGNKCSNEFRDLLKVVSLDVLQRYASEALNGDTTDLEAQIRGSRYSWQVRVISLEALFKMVALKSPGDYPCWAKLLRGILIPREFTKLDALLDIVSFVAEDVSSDEEEEEEE